MVVLFSNTSRDKDRTNFLNSPSQFSRAQPTPSDTTPMTKPKGPAALGESGRFQYPNMAGH